MKRALVFALALVFIVAIVPGMAFADGKKITVWCWDPNFNGSSMKAAAAVYNKAHSDVTIEVVDIPENIEGKIEAGLQAGGAGLPDITLYQDFRIEQLLQNYPKALADLKAAGVDYSKFAQYKLGPMSAGKGIYGIPFDTGSTGFFVRTDFLKAAGLNPDSYQKNLKWSDVIKLGTTLKAKTGKALISYDTTSFDFLRIMVQSSGTQFFNKDGSLNLRTPAMKTSLALLKEMNDKGILFQAEGWNNWISAINNGDGAGFVNALWMIGTLKSKPENAGKWMVVPTPLLEGVPGAQNASNNGGSSWYVFDSSPNKALAIDFLKSTWASSAPDALEFYNQILKNAGAMGCYLPSQKGSNYVAKDEFFYKSQPVFKDFAAWMAKVPVLMYTPNYVTMRAAVNNSILALFQGKAKSVDDAIAQAEAEYKQTIGQ